MSITLSFFSFPFSLFFFWRELTNRFSFFKDIGYYQKEILVLDSVLGYSEVSHATGCVFVSREVGCGDRALIKVEVHG